MTGEPRFLTSSIMRSHSSRRMQRKKRSARCSAPAWLVRRSTRQEFRRNCFDSQRFFDVLRQTVFHANARTQIRDQHGPLDADQFHSGADLIHRRIVFGRTGFLAEANKGRAHQALQLRFLLRNQLFADSLIASPMASPPRRAYRSATWLIPMAVFRRDSVSFTLRQLE